MLDLLADDVLLGITDMLTPIERCRFSACSRRLKRLLPSPLRIRITSCVGSSLGGDLFVSLVDDSSSGSSRMLTQCQRLRSSQRYYFWKYDETEQSKVYLGRHLRQTLMEGTPTRYRYTLAFRPKYPNQSWKVSSVREDGNSNSSNSQGNHIDNMISWGEDVTLTVSGDDPRAGQPDSNEEQVLSAKIPPEHGCSSCSWYVLDSKVSTDGKLRLLLSEQASYQPIQKLVVYSIPDICDKGAYLYYSPERWKPISTDGRCAIISFSFWVRKGVMYFRANLLPFTLGIPIMKLDRSFFKPKYGPVANLFESYSARWGCIKYYMATAADVGEGCSLNMESFLRGVTDHDEHGVIHKPEEELVYIVMQDEVDTELPDVQRDDNRMHRFFFSW